MSRCRFRDIDQEELNTGTIRHKPKRLRNRRPVASRLPHPGAFCSDCGKRGYQTEAAARDALACMARQGRLVEDGSFAVRPYLCHHGWWHFGRDRRTISKIKDFSRKNKAAA